MNNHLDNNWEKRSAERSKVYARYLKKVNQSAAIRLLPDLHDETFQQVNCLDCGNCCKGYSPRFKTPDIKRISRFLKIKESQFIAHYLELDEEGDYVTKSKPCPFLGENNACSIYEVRPSDCARFPYTDEDVFVKRPAITLKNVSFCPAAYSVIEHLMEQLPE